MMRLEEFHNALRILISLDRHDLEAAGVIEPRYSDWETFRLDPFRWFIRADDATARKLFTLIERRQTPMMVVTEAHRDDPEAAP